MPKASTILYTTYHLHYKEKFRMTKSVYKPSLLRPPPQLLSLPVTSSNYIVKVMKPFYNMQETSITRFAIYHLYYKEKSRMTKFVYNHFVLWPLLKVLSFLGISSDCCDWTNLSAALFLTHNSSACIAEPGMEEPPRMSIHHISDALQPLSLMLSLTLTKMRPAMFKYLAISKCAPIFKWQFSSTLTNFSLLANYLSV